MTTSNPSNATPSNATNQGNSLGNVQFGDGQNHFNYAPVQIGHLVVHLSRQTATLSTATAATAAAPNTPANLGSNPYQGLLAFHETDGDRYFGRAAEIQTLWERLRDLYTDPQRPRFLPIYGPSGSGKSSLARAGLIPALGRQPLPGKDQARVVVLVPGTKPLESLAGMLARIATNDPLPLAKSQEFERGLKFPNEAGEYDGLRRIVSLLPNIHTMPLIVLVDQFEEVYSLAKSDDERDAFIANLLHAAQDESQYVSVIITFRSDFLETTHQHPELNQLFADGHGFYTTLMKPAGLCEAITRPAANAGYEMDDAIVSLLLEQIEGRAGVLPLLQFALTRIWEKLPEQNPATTLNQIGGVGGALAGEAERIYALLSKSDQAIARHLFVNLVHLGEGTGHTRRRALVDSLISSKFPREQVIAVIQKFANPNVRLITSSYSELGAMVEVSHEALIKQWHRLHQWIEDNRDLLRQQRRIEESAVTWQQLKQDRRYLLEGWPLKEATQLQKQEADTFPLSDSAQIFLTRSQWKERWKWVKTASLLLIFIPIFDYAPHRYKVDEYFSKLNAGDQQAERESVNFLTQGCEELKGLETGYFIERFKGVYCRSLANQAFSTAAFLSDAEMSNTYLSEADLNQANLHNADLSDAYLSGANLHAANLSKAKFINADLRFANLSQTNLSNATFKNAILLATNLDNAVQLTADQLTGEASPLLCNVVLPDNLTNIDPNRDCLALAETLSQRYGYPIETAWEIISLARLQRWNYDTAMQQWNYDSTIPANFFPEEQIQRGNYSSGTPDSFDQREPTSFPTLPF